MSQPQESSITDTPPLAALVLCAADGCQRVPEWRIVARDSDGQQLACWQVCRRTEHYERALNAARREYNGTTVEIRAMGREE